MKNLSVIIPARMKSTRFPGKPLARICGLPMIHRVYNQALKAKKISDIYVATDSTEIQAYCNSVSIPCLMTGMHETGTDRVFEACKAISSDYIINLQGDEPLMSPELIDLFADALLSPDYNDAIILTAHSVCPLSETSDPNIVKVILSRYNKALYFTRSAHFSHTNPDGDRLAYKQLGIYGYSTKALNAFSELGYSSLELLEKIEILRWLDFGYTAKSVFSETSTYSVDTIDDLVRVESIITHSSLQ